MDTATPLLIELLGRPQWRLQAGCTASALSPQDAVLLALLALEGPQPRDALAGQLWPQATQKQAANNLRKHVSRLRARIGHAVVRADTTFALLACVRVDLHSVAELAPDRLLESELLAGFDYTDNDFLHEWVGERRNALRGLRADALAGHAEQREQRGELAGAIRLAQRVMELAPLHEHACRRLMRLHYLRSDHTAAIETFERFEGLLRDATGARPGPETLRLLTTIERGVKAVQTPTTVVPVSLVRPPLCVGRQRQQLAMQSAWAAGRAFLLLGEAGIGKSRLLAELAQACPGALVEQGRAGDAPVAFGLLARILRALLPRLPAPPSETEHAVLAHLMPELAPQPQAPTQESAVRAVAEALLARAAPAGVPVVLVDDLHFADVASLQALRWLSGSAAWRGLGWGFAARPLDASPVGALLRGWLDDSHRPADIEVPRLDAAGVEALLVALDLPEFAAPDLGTRLFAHTGGQPFYMLETLKDAWMHGRDIRVQPLPQPQPVQTLLARRLQDLPPRAQELASVAAVAGADLTAERAARLMNTDLPGLAEAWSQLEHANVLQGTGFAHDLMRSCALSRVPQALRSALHGRIAELLTTDPLVPAARVAEHFEAAERWGDAGRWWHKAGAAARMAGRLQEQHTLLERAAASHRRAGDQEAEFAAVHASFDGLLLRQGGAAVMAALPRLAALARQADAVLRCKLVEAEALLDLQRAGEALPVAAQAVQLGAEYPLLLGDALCLQSMALAQLGRSDEAVAAARLAVDAAHAAALPAQELRAARSLAYVLYAAGRLGESLPVQRRAARLAQQLGDEAESAAAEAAIAALLSGSGDVPVAHEHARQADARYRAMGLSHNSTVCIVNLVVLGQASAYLGRFGHALAALEEADRMSEHSEAAGLRAKVRIALAAVQLTLGQAEAARALVAKLPDGAPVGMRMHAALLLARAEEQEGGRGRVHFERLTRLGAEHPELPLVQSAWVEWSYQGDAATVLPRLRGVHAQFLALGLPGAARTVRLREVARLADLDDGGSRASAAALAADLLPFVASGMSAKTYAPEAWLTLATAFERFGQSDDAQRCRDLACEWIRTTALPQVPEHARAAFLARNAVNRVLLGDARAGP